MITYRIQGSNNPTQSMHIVGSKSENSSNDITSLIFQNYDIDTKKKYDMASIALRDHYGDITHNGYGDLIFKTNCDGSNLQENMRLTYDGNLLLGTSNDYNARLYVAGDIYSPSNIYGSYANFIGFHSDSNMFIDNDLNIYGSTTLYNNELVLSNYGNIFLYTSNNSLGVNTRTPRADVEFYNQNILSKNIQKLTKSTDNSNDVSIDIMWQSVNSYIILETTQMINDNIGKHGVKFQRHTLSTADYSIISSLNAEKWGNSSNAYDSLNINVSSDSNNKLTLTSHMLNTFNNENITNHSFTVNLTQIPKDYVCLS